MQIGLRRKQVPLFKEGTLPTLNIVVADGTKSELVKRIAQIGYTTTSVHGKSIATTEIQRLEVLLKTDYTLDDGRCIVYLDIGANKDLVICGLLTELKRKYVKGVPDSDGAERAFMCDVKSVINQWLKTGTLVTRSLCGTCD